MSILKLQRKAEKLVKSDDGTPPKTPREEAAETTESMKGTEYINARESRVANVGEDVLGSARHIAANWKGLNAAEADGSAEKLITLKNLKKLEPANFSNYQPGHDLSALAAHYCVEALPKQPAVDGSKGWGKLPDDHVAFHEYTDSKGHKYLAHPSRKVDQEPDRILTVGDIKKAARADYLDLYRFVSQKAEEALSQTDTIKHPNDIIKHVMEAAYSRYSKMAHGKSVRGYSLEAYLAGTTRKYINLHRGKIKKGSARGKLNEFGAAYKERYGEEEAGDQEFDDRIMTHVNDIVVGGKTLKKSFDLATKVIAGRKQNINRANLYDAELSVTGGPTRNWGDHAGHVKHLTDNVGLRAIQYGNSVTDGEREHHTQLVAHSFADMTELLGLPSEMGSFNGRLGVAIGARGKGKALAHYEPDLKVINLTRKNGIGTLAHEWAHFFDHILTKVTHDHSGYASDYHNLGTVKMQMSKETDMAEPKKRIHESYKNLFEEINRVKNRIIKDYHDRHPQLENVNNLSRYWLSNREMFARAFEKHIELKMQKSGRSNTYLSSSPDHPLWPSRSESTAIEKHFDELFKNFKESEYLKKSLDLLDKAYQKNGQWYPEHTDKGKERPDNPDQVGHIDKNGNATWAQADHIRDRQGQQLMRNFTRAKLSSQGRNGLHALIRHLVRDPDHHAMNSGTSPGSTGDFNEMRIRHVNAVLAGHKGYKLEDHGDGSLTIHAERHPTKNNPWKLTTWHFDGKNTLKSVKKDPIRNRTSEGSYTYGQQKLSKERSDGELDRGTVGGVRGRVPRSAGDSRRVEEGRHAQQERNHRGSPQVLRKSGRKVNWKPGKKVGSAIYVHKNYEGILPREELARAKEALGDFDYTIVKHDTKTGNTSFIHSPDWNTADEPSVGHSRTVSADGKVKERQPGKRTQIYHHKWQFVAPDYKGFDTAESRDRSDKWQAVVKEHGIPKNKIGWKDFWEENVLDKLHKALEMVGGSIDMAEKSEDPAIKKFKDDALEKAVPDGYYVMYADGDDAGSQVEKAVMKDELDEVKKISSRINQIGLVLKIAVRFLKGQVINHGGDDFCAVIPRDYDAKKLEAYRAKVEERTGFTVTIGIGDTSPHAIHALLYGKMHGKNQTVIWRPEIDEYIEKNVKPQTAHEKAAEILGAE